MLHIVGTPIGNLEDLSLRQAKTIAAAEIILSEDTRSTGFLLQKITEMFSITLNPSQRLISYYKEKEFEKLPEIMEMIEQDRNVVLISQAGMPLISDPGLLLVKTAIKRKVHFIVIPGPTAATTASVYAGVDPEYSMFVGFLPKKENDIIKIFQKLKSVKQTFPDASFIFYESPNRINDTLLLVDKVFPDNEVTVARELTKKFEEVVRGKAKALAKKTYRGEVTFVIG